MTPEELHAAPEAPDKGAAIQALWWAARNDWTHAHEAAQSDQGTPAAWVHGYLHRAEGDLDNARYWYARAGKPVATAPLDDEWRAIAAALLSSPASGAPHAATRHSGVRGWPRPSPA